MDIEQEATLKKYQVLKAKIGQIGLKEILRPHFLQLLEETTNPLRLALVLLRKGVMNELEREKIIRMGRSDCELIELNLAVYRIVMKANDGEALIDALLETKNFRILHLLQSSYDALDIPLPEPEPQLPLDIYPNFRSKKTPKASNKLSGVLATKIKANTAQTSVLKTSAMMTPPQEHEWLKIIGDSNLSKINDDLWHWTLARVVTSGDDKSSQKIIQATEFQAEEPQTITKFLESTLDLDLDKKTMGKAPLEIYINTRSFTHVEWTWLSKVLLLCRDSLENLWLDNVDYNEYCCGTEWMKNLTGDKKPSLRFSKLKSFIFVGDEDELSSETIHRTLLLLKSFDHPLEDFWNSGCAIHLYANNYQEFLLVVDPVNKTLLVDVKGENEDLTDEIAKIFKSNEAKSGCNRAAVTKFYYEDPQLDLISSVINRPLLTHLFLQFNQGNCIDVIQNLMDNLPEFKLLQKLFLASEDKWTVDLEDLDDLDNLMFLYCHNAECGGAKVDEIVWRKSVQTVMLNTCTGWSLKTPGLESGLLNEVCVKLERNRPQNAKVPAQLFSVSLLSEDDEWAQTAMAFCA